MSFSLYRRLSRGFVVVPLVIFVLLPAGAALARPSAMKLFPQETLLLVRTPNVHETVERLKQTANARMLRDPQLQPLVQRLTGGVGDLYTERAEGVLGVSWEELQNLPEGEVAFAIVARKDTFPAFLLLVDQGEIPSVAERLMDVAVERMQEQGGELSTETIAGVEVTVVRHGESQSNVVGMFVKENTIVAATDAGLLREVLRQWDGGELALSSDSTSDAVTSDEDEESAEELSQYSGRSLAENDKFVTILRHCRRPQDPPPNLIIFADPIGMLREFGRNSTGLKIAMAAFPALGVNGIAGVGTTQTFATDEYDTLAHMHLLLENPRAGVVQMIAFEAGDTTPQPWVFKDLETYMTWHWNMRASFNTLSSLVDRIQFEGATKEFVTEKISERLGIDFEAEVIDNLAGRYSWMIAYSKPARLRSQQHTFAFELADPAAGEETLQRVIQKFPDRFEERRFGDVTYHAIVIPFPPEMAEEDRPVDPFVAVMDGYFFIGGSCELFERAVSARDGTVERLVDSEGFRRLADQVQRETPGVTPAMWSYSQFEETLRHWYDMLTSDRTRDFLDQQAEGNPLFSALADALAENELPAFDVLARYAVPGVGVAYDTDSGLHMISFSLRNDAQAAAE